MPLPLEPLRSTDALGESTRCGIQKQWPLKSKTDDSLHWDYIQKVNYAVQDFNASIAEEESLAREGVVFAITLVDWINDAVERILSCYRDDTIDSFAYSRQSELDGARKYFRAVRSFVNAHPLGTDRHSTFGLDGSYICIDIRNKNRLLGLIDSDLYMLSPGGLEQVDDLREADVVLYAYSKADGGMFYHHIGLDLDDVCQVAHLCIDKLYELDKHLGRIKKKDYPTK